MVMLGGEYPNGGYNKKKKKKKKQPKEKVITEAILLDALRPFMPLIIERLEFLLKGGPNDR